MLELSRVRALDGFGFVGRIAAAVFGARGPGQPLYLSRTCQPEDDGSTTISAARKPAESASNVKL